jgi:hypothetical protein
MTPQPSAIKDPVSYADLARICRIDPATVTRWARCHFLPPSHVIRRSRRTGRPTRLGWPATEINNWLAALPRARVLPGRSAVLETDAKSRSLG